MKKFMIFLLMAFLYLGTCQARSEATHLNSANDKLHTWVTPSTPLGSPLDLLMSSGWTYGEPMVMVAPSQPQNLCITCPHNNVVFSASYDLNGYQLGGSSPSLHSYQWFVNGLPTDSTEQTFKFTGYPVGQYSVSVKMVFVNGSTYSPAWESNSVIVTVVDAPVVNIEGPGHACQNDMVTLTAVLDNTSIETTYQWRRNGQYIVGATNAVYQFHVADLPGLGDSLVYEFDVIITQAGCDSKTSPVHYFSVSPTPVTLVDTPLFCKDDPSVTVTANSYTSGDEHPYMWKWKNVATGHIDTTYVNTYTIANPQNGDKYSVMPIYQDLACNADTADFELKTYQEKLQLTADLAALTLKATPDRICQGVTTSLKITDNNTSTQGLGAATYAWYMDGALLDGVTDTAYTVALPNAGSHVFKVVASYANYPCENPSGTATVTVDTAASVTITGRNVICQNADGTYSRDTLTAQVVPSTGTYKYKWTGDASFGSESTKEISAPGVYTVIVKTTGGCEYVSEPFEVFGFGPNVEIAASEVSCPGVPVELSVHVNGWTGAVSYAWDGIPGDFSTVTVFPTTDEVYKVTSTVNLGNGRTCSTTDSIHVYVLPVNATTPTVALVSPDSICVGSIAKVRVSNHTTGLQYVWYHNGIAIPGHNLDTISIVLNDTGVHKFAAAVVTANGCVSAASSSPATTVVLPQPSVMITGDPIICDADSVKLFAIINDTVTLSTDYSYEWRLYNYTLEGNSAINHIINGSNYPGASDVINNGNTSFTVFADDDPLLAVYDIDAQDYPYIFTVVVSNENGCRVMSEPYFVYVGDSVHVAVTVDRDTICEGGLVTATAHLGNYNMDNLVYQWYEKNKVTGVIDTIAHGTSPVHQTYVDNSVVLMVKVTQTNTMCTAFGKDSVYVLPVKLEKIVAKNETHLANESDTLKVCKGEAVYLTAYVKNTETGREYVDSSFTYVWYENGFLMPGVTGPTFHKQLDIIDNDTLSYQYTAYIDFGIEGCEPQLVSSNVVFVKPNPVVTISGHHNVCYFGPYEDAGFHNVHLIAWVDGDYDPNLTYTWYEHGMQRYSVAGSIFDNHYRETWTPTYDNPWSFTVTVRDSSGCVTTSEPFEVNVYNKPAVNVTASETEICKGGVVEVTAHLDNYNDPNLIYQWYKDGTDPGDLIPAMTEFSEEFVVNDNATYIVKVTHLLENGTLNAQACYNYASVSITANDIPVIDSVTTDLADGGDTICEGRYVTFTAHISKGVRGGEVYTWYRNGEVIAQTPDSVYRETPQALNGDITVWDYAVSVRQVASGCESAIKGADTITVYPNPVLRLVTDPIVCDTTGMNIVMYAHVNPIPTSPYKFRWFEDNSADTLRAAAGQVEYFGAHNDSIKVKKPYRDYAYNFAVEMVNGYGCTTRDDASVLVNDNPVVHAMATEYNICQGGVITLTANLDDYNADMLEFHWYDKYNGVARPIGTATELTYTLALDSVGVHKFYMSALQRTSLCIAYSDTVTVKVDSIPVIDSVTNDLAAAKDTICEGRYVTLTAHVHGGVRGGEVYTWYRNGAVIPSAHDSIYVETPEALNGDVTTYQYAVSVKQTAAGCESDTTQAAVVTVYPNPVLRLVTDPIVCDTTGMNIVMYAHVNPIPTSPYKFRWFEDNSADTLRAAAGQVEYFGAHNDSIKVKKPYRDYAYNFAVEMVNGYGCTTRDDASVLVNDNPVVHARVSDPVICVGGEITLTANLDDYNADMLEFHWYDSTSTVAAHRIGVATELDYTVVPSLDTHYYFMTALQRTSGCIASSDTLKVIVKKDPVIKEVRLSDYMACEGAQVRIEAIADSTTYMPSATDVYTWYRNGVRIIGATNRVLYDSPVTVDQNTQQFVYTAVVTLEEPGCTSLPKESTPLTIYRNPVVAITGDQHVCETDYTFLIANVDTLGRNVGNLHYTWYVDGQPNYNMSYTLGDSRFFADYLYPRDEAYIVTVNVERGDVANACASMSAPYEVYVYPKPEVNITPDVTDICAGGEVTLQANLNDYNAEHITFQWYEVRTVTDSIAIDYAPGGGYIYDVVTTSYNYYIPGATGFRYTATLDETTTLGVKVLQTNSQCYDIDEFTVTVHRTPAAPTITVNHPMICSAGDVDLTITNDYSEYGTPVFAWMMDGQLIPGAFGSSYHQEPGLTFGTTHTYNAVVTFDMPGCVSLTSSDADVVVIPDPVVTVIADGPTTICEGGEVSFSANAQPTTLAYTYQWYDNNNQLIAGETNHTLTVSPAANQQNYNYKVVVNSLPGCQIVVDAPVVTVVADPVVTLTIDNPIVCQGGVSTLMVDVQGGINNENGLDPYVYNWYSNVSTETPFATTSENYYTLPTNLATDSFAYWVEVSANTYGCATTSSHVNQLVVADPVVAVIVAPTYPTTVCDGGNTMLVATVQGGYGEPSYQWYRNETILVGETHPTLNTGILSVNDINSYHVIVTQTGSDCETVSDTFQVPVIPTYNVVVSALNNATVCEGGTTTMEAVITNTTLSNDNPTFQWYEIVDGANVALSGATSTRYTTSPLLTDGNHTYFVAVNSQVTGSGCSAHSNSFYTAIVDDPTVVVSTTAVNDVVCEGDVVNVNATVSPVGGAYTYTWTWSNGTNSYSNTTNVPTFTPNAGQLPASINGYLFNVSIASTDPNSGCNASSNSNVYVTVMERPVVTITADNAAVCAGGHVELTANHNASDYTGFNYAWTVNGQPVASTLQTITVPASMVVEGSVNASVTVTSSQISMNCPSTAVLATPVQVLAQPTVSVVADHLTMCAGAAPILTASVSGTTPMTYIWQQGGTTISGANDNVYQPAPLAAGVYTFNVKAVSLNADLNCQTDWADAVVVRVAETPVIGLTSADGLALCEGGDITLTATVLNANNTVGDFTNGSIYGKYNYIWTNNNNVVAVNNDVVNYQNQLTQTLNTVGTYNYVVNVKPVGTLANGCGVASSEPLAVVVNAKPNWDAAVVNPANGNICLGEEVQLYAHITGGVTDMNGNTNGHIQWVVEFNGVPSNVSNYGGSASHTPTVAGVYTYYPTYVPYEGTILGSGCSFTNSNQVSTFVTVHELPTAAFVSGNGSTICANVSDATADLTVHFTGTAPFHFIVTDLSTGLDQMYDSYTNDYTLYVNPTHTTQYRITYLSDNYCNNGELGLDAIATVYVNDIQFGETFFQSECGENTVTISFNMISGTPNADFTVTYDNGLVVTGTISNNSATFATPDVPGDYHAVFSVGGCDYDIIVRRPVFISEFSDGTTPLMMQRWDDVVIINNNPTTNGGHTFISYQWYRNGEAIPGAIYKNYQEIGGLNGFYSIEVVSKEADGSVVTYRTCEQYFYANTSVKVYPVPATVQQVVTIELDMNEKELEDATLDIYDAVGSIVNHISVVKPITKVSGFKAAGTYFGRITMANGESKTVKFVIVK